MLILGRKPGEEIVCGRQGEIRIRILECDRHGVRIGLEAPQDIPILRAELVDRVAKQNRAALQQAAETEEAARFPVSRALAPTGGSVRTRALQHRPVAGEPPADETDR
jgi:carbon storage regulator